MTGGPLSGEERMLLLWLAVGAAAAFVLWSWVTVFAWVASPLVLFATRRRYDRKEQR